MGNKGIAGTISNLNKKAYEHIENWRTRPLSGEYPYVYVDGVYLKRSWGGEIQNVSILVAIGVIVNKKVPKMLEKIPHLFSLLAGTPTSVETMGYYYFNP